MKSPLDGLELAVWGDRQDIKNFSLYQSQEQKQCIRRLLKNAVVLPFPLATIAIDTLFLIQPVPVDMQDPWKRVSRLSPFAVQRSLKVSYIQTLTTVRTIGLAGMAMEIRDKPKASKGTKEEKQRIQEIEHLFKQIYLFLSYCTVELAPDQYNDTHDAITRYLQDTLPTESSKLADTLCINSSRILSSIMEKG